MVYRKTKISPITRETIESNAKRWLTKVKYSESGVVIQVQDDAEYRVGEILGDAKLLKQVLGPYYRKYILAFVTVTELEYQVVILEELEAEVKKRKIKFKTTTNLIELVEQLVEMGYEVGLFIKYGGDNQGNLWRYLEQILEEVHNTSITIFVDKNVSVRNNLKLINECSLMFDQIEKYPLYGKKDMMQFISYNEEMWGVSTTDSQEEFIIENCGGYLWLVSHLQRYLRDNSEQSLEKMYEDEGLRIKLATIYGKLGEEEREILRAVCIRGLSSVEKSCDAYYFLRDVGMIRERGRVVELAIPLLEIVIKGVVNLDKLQDDKGTLFIGEKELGRELSELETKVLVLLTKNKRSAVSREAIARQMWGDDWEERYSDWAIDRIIYRIRNKLKMLGIDQRLLKNRRKLGYQLG